jgi:hypothetical protein
MNTADLWLPGVGVVPSNVRAAQTAIEAYSDDLELGFNERTKTWVVLWRHGPDGAPFPVWDLGETLPSFDEIQRQLYKADVRRHGGKLVDEVVKRNEERKEAAKAEMREIEGDVAEVLEHAFRRMGKTSYSKVYLPDFRVDL